MNPAQSISHTSPKVLNARPSRTRPSGSPAPFAKPSAAVRGLLLCAAAIVTLLVLGSQIGLAEHYTTAADAALATGSGTPMALNVRAEPQPIQA